MRSSAVLGRNSRLIRNLGEGLAVTKLIGIEPRGIEFRKGGGKLTKFLKLPSKTKPLRMQGFTRNRCGLFKRQPVKSHRFLRIVHDVG